MKKIEVRRTAKLDNYISLSALKEVLKNIPDTAIFKFDYEYDCYDSIDPFAEIHWLELETDEEWEARKLAKEKRAIQRRMEADEKERRELDLYAKLKKKYERG